jgi:predicted nucleotidyltransferase
MTRSDVLDRLADLRPWLASQGVTRLRIFGSHARDEATEASDLDLLIDLDPPLGLKFFSLESEIGARLGLKVDLVTESALAPDIRHTALADAIDA